MNTPGSNSNTCDDDDCTPASRLNGEVDSDSLPTTTITTTTTPLTTGRTTVLTTVEHCDLTEDEMSQENPCSTIVSPPASPVDMKDDEMTDIRPINHNNNNNRTANIDSSNCATGDDFKSMSTSCTHCANSATTTASMINSPLCDVTNKRQSAACEIISVIRRGKFDEFTSLLSSKQNVDVNTFVNGNTALHYCLLFGKLFIHNQLFA